MGKGPQNPVTARKDGYVFVAAFFESHWERFCRILGREDLIDDPRSATSRARGQNRQFLDEIVVQWTREKTAAKVVDILTEARLVVALILDFEQIIQDAHAREREMVAKVEHPEARKIQIYGVAPKFSLTPGRVRSAAPLLGEHNRTS
ncbi:MAG: CoA transferase [Chloroflexi bacterium]|nr:CoA transferase [Chloroflexota bacterium]